MATLEARGRMEIVEDMLRLKKGKESPYRSLNPLVPRNIKQNYRCGSADRELQIPERRLYLDIQSHSIANKYFYIVPGYAKA
jgi:hypothetical protein